MSAFAASLILLACLCGRGLVTDTFARFKKRETLARTMMQGLDNALQDWTLQGGVQPWR